MARAARRPRPNLRILLHRLRQRRLAPSDDDWEVLRKPDRADELTQAARRALS